MVSIILSAYDEAKKLALAAGFREETVLIRHEMVTGSKENEDEIVSEIINNIHPNQFLVANYWGACPD